MQSCIQWEMQVLLQGQGLLSVVPVVLELSILMDEGSRVSVIKLLAGKGERLMESLQAGLCRPCPVGTCASAGHWLCPWGGSAVPGPTLLEILL